MSEDHFGGCPECGQNDGYQNIYRHHFFFCEEHCVAWLAGHDLFSSWREEDEADWREAWEELKGYRVYDRGTQQLGPSLGEVTSLEFLIPPPTPGGKDIDE